MDYSFSSPSANEQTGNIKSWEKLRELGNTYFAYSFISVATLVILIWFPINLNCNAVHDLTITYETDTSIL